MVVKAKVKWIYIAPGRETSKVLRHGSHSVTCKNFKIMDGSEGKGKVDLYSS